MESAQQNIVNGRLTKETRRQPKKEGMKGGERRVENREMENGEWREEMQLIAGAGVGKIRCFPRKQLPFSPTR
jgi:hypothetical protein